MRFSFENTPIIFAGMIFGPIVEALVGTVADLVGCVMVAYEINPLVTLGAALIGLISGIVFYISKSGPICGTYFFATVDDIAIFNKKTTFIIQNYI